MTTNDSKNSDNDNVPENANEGCVGPASANAGKSSACEGCPNQSACASGSYSNPSALASAAAERQQLQSALSCVSHVILVLSGKGGVGKSTVAAQLAHTLSARGFVVGFLDVDLCGPSAPRMLGLAGNANGTGRPEVHKSGSGWTPVYANENLAVMSISFLLPDADAAVVWRGPRKNGLIKQFLMETDWSGCGSAGSSNGQKNVDYLIVDTPPGTSDEHISTVQYLQSAATATTDTSNDGRDATFCSAVVVTTPEEVSMADVRKELNFCQKTKLRVLGVVENMSKLRMKFTDLVFLRPSKPNGDDSQEEEDQTEDCTQEVHELLKTKCPSVLDLMVSADIFSPTSTATTSSNTAKPKTTTGPEAMAERYNVPFLGRLPLDPNLLQACEDGACFVDAYPNSPAATPMENLVAKVVKALPIEGVEVVMDTQMG